jgi:hypothetical protein
LSNNYFDDFLGAYLVHGPEVPLIRTKNTFLWLQIHNSSQRKGVFFMANLEILVWVDSRALLTFCRGSQIARLTTFRTWRIFVWWSSIKRGWKAMIFNVKIHRSEVVFICRNWSFDKKNKCFSKSIFVYLMKKLK